MKIKTHRSDLSRQDGFALIYLCATLTVLLLFTGVAVDSGRAYVVKAQLSKAVDGAALAAARNLNSGTPKAEAVKDIQSQFSLGIHGNDLGRSDRRRQFFHLGD